MRTKLVCWNKAIKGRTQRIRLKRAKIIQGQAEKPDPDEDPVILNSRIPETEPNPRKLTIYDIVDMGLVNQVEPIGIDNTW